MTETAVNFVKIYLKPAELCVSKAPAMVTTVLGSCIAVTMWDPETGVAAICHAPQPDCPKSSMECPRHCIKKYHYVSCVIPEMLIHMEAAGVKRGNIEVKIFGGASVLATFPRGSIGRKNIDTALSLFKHYGFEPKAKLVGGRRGCKIVLNTHTGEVMFRYIQRSETPRSTEDGADNREDGKR
jgi:chemotaxis protein CheD